ASTVPLNDRNRAADRSNRLAQRPERERASGNMQLAKGTAFALVVCLSIACGMSDEAVKITDGMADEATKLDEQVNEMFAHGRVGGAVIVLVRCSNACDDAIAGIEKHGGLRAG